VRSGYIAANMHAICPPSELPVDDGAIESGCVHESPNVVRPLFERGGVRRTVGEPSFPLVEAD
jgi:hypothetical protein